MARPYFTLLIRDAAVWAPQFGDYDREVVEQEEQDTYASRYSTNYAAKADRKIIKTAAGQKHINAAIAALNRPQPITEAEAIEYAIKLAPEVDSRPMTVISARRSHDDDDGYVVMTSIGRCDVWRLPNGQLYGEY
jgi:hypothetical protein